MNCRAFVRDYGKTIILLILLMAYFAIAEEISSPQDSQVPEQTPGIEDGSALPQEPPAQETGPGITEDTSLPENAEQPPAADESPLVIPEPPTAPSHEIAIVSPLAGQTVNGAVILIVAVSGSEECATVKANDAEQAIAFEGQACQENNYIIDWNSEQAANGNYEISARACNAENCVEEKIPVIVENALQLPSETAQETEPGIADTNQPTIPETPGPESEGGESEEFFVKGSGGFSMLALKDLNGELVNSGSELVKAKKGNYNASIAFIEGAVKEAELENVLIDSNQTLLEIDEEIEESGLESPEGFFLQIIAINPKASFSKGILRLNVPSGAEALFKCKEWDFAGKKCQGSWEKIQEIAGETVLEVPISPNDPGFGFAGGNEISFGRRLECHKCGQHKAPPTTNIQMEISASSKQPLQNAVLADYFPASWLLVDAQGGTVSDWNSEFKKIEWNVDSQDSITKTYTVQSPGLTTPPTEYYFFSQLNEFYSEYWRVIVSDANAQLQTCIANDAAATEETWADACDGGADSTNTFLNSDDASVETQTANRKFAGVKITTNNWGISDCVSISNVTLYYKWWVATADTEVTHYIAVSRDGTNWVNAVDVAPPNTEAASVSTVDATALVSWTCADFGAAGGAAIKSNVKDGTNATYTWNWDVLKYVITYVPTGKLSFDIANPPADNNTSVNNNTNFLVNGTTYCNTNNCGTVDTNLQYCVGAGCSGWMDLNTDTGSPLYLVSGSNPQSSSLNAGQNYNVSWIAKSSVAQTYELRFSGTGTTADANTTNGTDRTITTQAVANDYSFTISLPSSGCTEGKGCLTGGCTACTRCYFDASTGTGSDQNFADRNQTACQGQSSIQPFFKFANTSTTSSDENWDMNLDIGLAATYRLKIGVVSTAYQANCADVQPPTTGCVTVLGTTNIRIANAIAYNADKNAWAWADFVSATPAGDYNRTLYHTSS